MTMRSCTNQDCSYISTLVIHLEMHGDTAGIQGCQMQRWEHKICEPCANISQIMRW